MTLPLQGITDWAVLMLAALVIGFSKTGLPGVAVLSIPLAALVLPAKASTGIILPMLIAGDLFAVAYYRRHARWSHLLRLLPFGFAGILIGYWLLSVVTDGELRPLIGALILAMLVLSKWREHSGEGVVGGISRRHGIFAFFMGLAAGIATMMANAAGPIMMLYLLAMDLPKQEFIGTGAWYFFIVNCFKVPFSWNLGLIHHDSLLLNLWLLPATVAGAAMGILAVRHIPQKLFVNLVQVVTVIAAVKLLF